mgnify:FL=1
MSVNDLVFTNDSEAKIPWRPELVSRRWERLRKRAGLDHVKLHGLRHFVATELLTGGIDLRTVSNRLGPRRLSTSTGHGSLPRTKQLLHTSTPCSTHLKRFTEPEPQLSRSARMISC